MKTESPAALAENAPETKQAITRKPPKVWRWIGVAAVSILGAAWITVDTTFLESPGQKQFATVLMHLGSVFDSAPNGKGSVSATLEMLRANGAPKELAKFKAQIAIDGPEHLWLETTVSKEPLQLARTEQKIWVWEPGKSFGVIGESGVPRFAAEPDTSRDDTHLGPLSWPFPTQVLAGAPRFFSVETGSSEEVDGQPCDVLHVTPRALVAHFLKSSPPTLTVWARRTDGWPVQIEYTDQRGSDVMLGISNLLVGEALPASRWRIPAPSDVKIEHVALSHLRRCLSAGIKLAKIDLPTLGPAIGEHKLVATHGKGRLEMRDGTRVLFLRGTPEEMGDQQGTLLKPEVRDLVDLVLYGVGVGSSFSKGRWFFGEIEQCQARVERFTDPRALREMDAMAKAAGLDKQEMRLANFFPELFHCSGFALMGNATTGGRIFQGRILDYLRGVGLEANAVVTVNQPNDAHAWVNISYAGFTGSVTAMNDQHISIGEMGGRGEGNWDGKPMAQLVREVMEKASTLDEAVEIMKRGPRTCEYFYVIADGKAHTAVGLAATPEQLDVLHPGEAHPRLPTPLPDAVLMSAGDRYHELVRRVQAGYGHFDADSARELMTRPVCMNSNIHSVLFAPDTLDFWVANADGKNVASAARYTQYNLGDLLKDEPARQAQ